MKKREHIPGTLAPGVRRWQRPETTAQRRARLYPGGLDREEGARYYVTRAKRDREYLKVWTARKWRDSVGYSAAACALAGDPSSIGSVSVRPSYLMAKCRRVTEPRKMPEPWRSILIPLSMTATEAANEDLFSPATPCPTCGFHQSCAACRQRIVARTDELAREHRP